jgi:hypothetical protein
VSGYSSACEFNWDPIHDEVVEGRNHRFLMS